MELDLQGAGVWDAMDAVGQPRHVRLHVGPIGGMYEDVDVHIQTDGEPLQERTQQPGAAAEHDLVRVVDDHRTLLPRHGRQDAQPYDLQMRRPRDHDGAVEDGTADARGIDEPGPRVHLFGQEVVRAVEGHPYRVVGTRYAGGPPGPGLEGAGFWQPDELQHNGSKYGVALRGVFRKSAPGR